MSGSTRSPEESDDREYSDNGGRNLLPWYSRRRGGCTLVEMRWLNCSLSSRNRRPGLDEEIEVEELSKLVTRKLGCISENDGASHNALRQTRHGYWRFRFSVGVDHRNSSDEVIFLHFEI
jgi:hypothetical protein